MKRSRKSTATILVAALALSALSLASRASYVLDPCQSESSCFFGTVVLCPAGDGDPLSGAATIYVTVRDFGGTPIYLIPAADFWVTGCNGGLNLCFGSGSSNADADTDTNGQTTISGAVRAGGCDNSLAVVVQGQILVDWPACSNYECHSIEVRSPDVNGDLVVDIIDFATWGPYYQAAAFPPCYDFTWDGVIDIVDFSIFGQHFLHTCS